MADKDKKSDQDPTLLDKIGQFLGTGMVHRAANKLDGASREHKMDSAVDKIVNPKPRKQ